MADALLKKNAPLIDEGAFLPEFQFDTEKKYMYELVEELPVRELPVVMVDAKTNRSYSQPHQKHQPFRNLLFTSQIVWKGQRRTLRYYDGCTTLWVDEQPKDKDIIDQYIKQTKKRDFVKGVLGIEGYDRMLLIYMELCSWNAESKYRTRTANAIFVPLNSEKRANEITSKLDLIEEAMRLAREAKPTKMKIHAGYLGIPETDWESGNDLTEGEIRAMYREKASENPKHFIDTYGNQAIEINYYIDKALQDGTISNKFNPNKATWGTKNIEICDISGLKSNEAISQKLFEFSQSEQGAEFLIQLKALYS